MTVLTELKNKLINLPSEIPFMLAEVFTELASTVEDFNIFQLQKGERADGSTLPNYSPRSVQVYGKPAGPIKLYDEGDFYRGITLKVVPGGIELVGLDVKTAMLQLRYGDDIIGLSEESIDRLMKEYVKPLLEEKIAIYLGVTGLRIAA